MITYKINESWSGPMQKLMIVFINQETGAAFTAGAVENKDYQNFKAEINANEAQLEDAEGKLMTPEEAKAYVATLP